MYLVKKLINGKEYYYARESVRNGKKVSSKNVAYLGKTKEEAEEKFNKIKIENGEKKDKMNYVLLHGYTGSPEANFFPWLKKELEDKGYKVDVPRLPNSENPNIIEQINYVLKNCKFNENTILLGHSLGSVVALKVIEKLKKPIKKSIFVAGFSKPNKDNPKAFEKTFDGKFDFEKIKENSGEVLILRAENDSIISHDRADVLKSLIGGKIIDFRAEENHVCGKIEPEVLKACMESIKNTKKQESGMEKKDNFVKITYFVHGTTTDNEKKLSSGMKDVELSELGIKQSKELTGQTTDKKFDVVFTSDLKRAVDSTNISFAKKYKIIIDKRLRECDYGDFNGKESKIVEPMQEENIIKRFPNGESYEDVKKRIKEFLNYLYRHYSGKHVAIVAHKAPQLAIEVLLNNKSWKQAFEEDWRKKGKWQPGWEYFINHEIQDNNMAEIKKADKKVEVKEQQKVASKLTIDELATFCKRKGFVFKSSEIYGGMAGFWDFGPLGAELFNNLKQDFWKFFVHDKENMVGIEDSIISHPKTWEASGHIASFSDVAVVCKKCKKATKLDKSEVGKVKCECGGEYDVQGTFSLMFKTTTGALNPVDAYLRGETAQGMFLDFKQIYESSRVKLPFGIVQIGRCFRNEIAPRDFLFRCREFTIGEFEFFIHPDSDDTCGLLDDEHLNLRVRLLDAETQDKNGEDLKETTIGKMLNEKRLGNWHAYWLAEQMLWFKKLGILEGIKIREHKKSELSHYSSATFDLDYEYPFGSLEVGGNANRGQYDLKQHEKFSGEKMDIFDEATKQRIIPRVIEPTFGIDRVFLALLCKGYCFDEKRQNIILKLPAYLAPIKAAVFPIIKGDEFEKTAREVFLDLKKEFKVIYDNSGSVGRRYARNDEVGTPFCITIDGDSVKDKSITIRNRDTTEQIRVKISELREILRKLISGELEFLKAGKKIDTRVKEE